MSKDKVFRNELKEKVTVIHKSKCNGCQQCLDEAHIEEMIKRKRKDWNYKEI